MITLTKRALVAALGGTVAVAATIVVLVLTLSGTDTFTLRGSFTLQGGNIVTKYFDAPGECIGAGGYDDVRPGTQVTVYSTSGEVLAIGELGPGEGDLLCAFPITVEGVPEGHKMYQVEVSHRGKIAITAEEAKAGTAAFSLG